MNLPTKEMVKNDLNVESKLAFDQAVRLCTPEYCVW